MTDRGSLESDPAWVSRERGVWLVTGFPKPLSSSSRARPVEGPSRRPRERLQLAEGESGTDGEGGPHVG